MTTFLDAFTIPGVAHNLWSYLNAEDEVRYDSTCKDVRIVHREFVYKGEPIVDYDEIAMHTENCTAIQSQINKRNKYATHIYWHGFYWRSGEDIDITVSPNLKVLDLRIPIDLDITRSKIMDSTHEMCAVINRCLNQICNTKNNIHTIKVQPGDITLIKFNLDTEEEVLSRRLYDYCDGSHLKLYKKFGMPIFIDLAVPNIEDVHLIAKRAHLPRALMSLRSRILLNDIPDTALVDWDDEDEGVAGMMVDLM
jgi:hypothetical protein